MCVCVRSVRATVSYHSLATNVTNTYLVRSNTGIGEGNCDINPMFFISDGSSLIYDIVEPRLVT